MPVLQLDARRLMLGEDMDAASARMLASRTGVEPRLGGGCRREREGDLL
jgi:hypothetical protein